MDLFDGSHDIIQVFAGGEEHRLIEPEAVVAYVLDIGAGLSSHPVGVLLEDRLERPLIGQWSLVARRARDSLGLERGQELGPALPAEGLGLEINCLKINCRCIRIWRYSRSNWY